MKKIVLILMIPLAFMFVSSCELLEGLDDLELSEEDIVNGLKTALKVGADTSSTVLSATDGYYGDELVKILLPEKAKPMLKYVDYLEKGSTIFSAVISTADMLNVDLGVDNLQPLSNGFVEKTIKSINRSAELAAQGAKPIFVNAITGITISDGLNILQGNSTQKSAFDSIAATNYLKQKTYENLVGLYSPKIDSTLNIVVLSYGENKSAFTTNQLWEKLLKYYNYLITMSKYGVQFNLIGENTVLGRLSKEQLIDQNLSLGQYATGKALTGLFYKVGLEEKKIRKDPFQWGLDILDKVFGEVYVAPTGE